MANIIEQLKTLKSHEEAGFVARNVEEQGRQRLMQAIEHSDDARANVLANGLAYMKWNFDQFVSKPLVIASAALVLVAGGWMTSVNAASNSLPGDTLYTFKLVAERARLQLASVEHRAILHTEFAQRRYEEALAIEQLPGRQVYFEETINAFKEQMNLASTSLDKLRDENNEGTLEVAVAIDQKINSLNTVIDSAQANVNQVEDIEKVSQVREVTQGAEKAVLDVVVSTHENAEEPSKADLDQLFHKELTELRTREARNLARLDLIESLIEQNEEVLEAAEFPVDENIGQIRFLVTDVAERDGEAMNLAAAGGYRAAFDILSAANDSLLGIEDDIAAIEIDLMSAISRGKQLLEESLLEEDLPNDENQLKEEN